MQEKFWVALGSVLAALAVGMGAMGAHLIKGKVSAEALANFDTAARYHLVHAVGLVLVGILLHTYSCRGITTTGWLFLLGIILFSGSLYAYVLTEQKTFAMIVPFGGAAWIIGWLVLAFSIFRAAKK